MEKEIGKITHYFDKIGVAVIKLKGSIKVGDNIRIDKGDSEFEQTIDSMQVKLKSIEKAKKGEEVGLKVNEEVKEGNIVYLLK